MTLDNQTLLLLLFFFNNDINKTCQRTFWGGVEQYWWKYLEVCDCLHRMFSTTLINELGGSSGAAGSGAQCVKRPAPNPVWPWPGQSSYWRFMNINDPIMLYHLTLLQAQCVYMC